jgi:hypothetical protein
LLHKRFGVREQGSQATMRRTGTPAQPKFDYQLAWLKRLAALAGPLRERRPVVLALWRMLFGKAFYERGGEREARK